MHIPKVTGHDKVNSVPYPEYIWKHITAGLSLLHTHTSTPYAFLYLAHLIEVKRNLFIPMMEFILFLPMTSSVITYMQMQRHKEGEVVRDIQKSETVEETKRD